MTSTPSLRDLPSIDKLLQHPLTGDLLAAYGRSLTVEALRSILDEQRQAILEGNATAAATPDTIVQTAHDWLENILAPTLRPVINATGIILHTNLGRAPLSASAIAATNAAALDYSTLEYDIVSGKRGSRTVHADKLLQRLTGTDAAFVVNNNAAAVLLMLMALCQGKEVIISRGQLVEIGGGFRIPDVMAQSGAKLVEVGTTNRTHIHDYANAITPDTAAILVAHHSNYKIIGFTTTPALDELAALAHANNILLLFDQGSGALLDVAPFGLEPEPTVPDGLAAGVDVIAFSGDKLLGGPQAGILCGSKLLINQIRRHPLARAVRSDKLCLAALSATLTHYLTGDVLQAVPLWQMLSRSLADIEKTAVIWQKRLKENGIKANLLAGESRVGGGSLPGTSLATKLIVIDSKNVEKAASDLRAADIPVISRIQDGHLVVDPRTVLVHQEKSLLDALIKVFIGN